MTDGNKNFMSGGTSPATFREKNGAGDSSDGRESEAAAVPSPREITGEACIVPGAGDRSMKEPEAAVVPSRRLTNEITGEAFIVPEAGENGGDRRMAVAPPVQPRRSQLTDQSRSSSLQEHDAVAHVDNGAKHQRPIKQRLRRNGGGDMWKNIQFPPWLVSNEDMLSEILGRLPAVQMLQATIVSRLFKRVITSHGFRCLVRTTVRQPGHLLGLFPKCKANKRERYPFIKCSDSADPIPRPLRNASLSVLRFWKPADYWAYFELLDSRDGKLLLLAGNSSRNVEIVVFYPQSSTNQYDLIPRPTVLDEANIRLVTAALIPEEESHHFTVIVLTRRGVVDSQMKPEVPVAESSVICYTSSNRLWGNPVTTQFEMPAKKMIRLGSVLVGKTLHFLHSCKQVIKVNVQTLKLGKLELPNVTNIRSKTAHVLTRGLTNNQLYLAVVFGRDIATYTHSGTGWDPALLLRGPVSCPFVAIKLVGSSEAGGLILVKVDGRVISTMEVETGLERQITNDLPEEEVLCYEQEFPPVSQMLRHGQPED